MTARSRVRIRGGVRRLPRRRGDGCLRVRRRAPLGLASLRRAHGALLARARALSQLPRRSVRPGTANVGLAELGDRTPASCSGVRWGPLNFLFTQYRLPKIAMRMFASRALILTALALISAQVGRAETHLHLDLSLGCFVESRGGSDICAQVDPDRSRRWRTDCPHQLMTLHRERPQTSVVGGLPARVAQPGLELRALGQRHE